MLARPRVRPGCRLSCPPRQVGRHREGLVILTESLKSHAGIADAVSFAGLGDKFQIREPGRFRAHLKEAAEQVRAPNKQLGSQRPEPGTGVRK